MASRDYSIATLGSHCALQLLKGAKDEGLSTLLVCEKKRLNLYKRFRFIDEIFVVDNLGEITSNKCLDRLQETNSVLIPHGTLIAYMDSDQIERISIPIFGNKWILRWEADRELKQKLMERSNLSVSKSVESKKRYPRIMYSEIAWSCRRQGIFYSLEQGEF